ncbi:T9SS-dependent M36 family metallopeptidase [Chryseobacterium potabilaquae]|uniref:Por secretion system C-terminal sorting domain-containing protein n=1 Tax=Chryseobacterium potabilaquae TaxID=2675057 RepID=A0A6N4XEI0_9FLAO|nr:T9SS-dependent M36 family metallopeptidase [Chryseobacterium potabilaquae]CAA7197053.1 hypothetical protein CHRY9293_03110 [Chryseobacterium potabilaquae]
MKKIIQPICFMISITFPHYMLGQDHEKMIKNYIFQNKIKEYKKPDLIDLIIDNVDGSPTLNGNIVKFQQLYNRVPIYNSVGTALIKDKNIIYYVDNFLKNYNATKGKMVSISKQTALQKVADHLQKQTINSYPILDFKERNLSNKQVAIQRLVYFNDGGILKLSYEFYLREPESSNHWDILVDASSGDIINKINLSLSCDFHPDAYSSMSFTSQDDIIVDRAGEEILSLVPDNASYNVFALPVEAPTFGLRSIVSNPWILSSSPEGWHSDGTNHYTITRGNNVYAYEDTSHANVPGFSPDGGASRNFNFPYSNHGTPVANQNAAITNLFYTNNKAHDIFYQLGFTESARNFQENNFANGGLGNDYVFAEAQDGFTLNNANFDTPPDGLNPTMQMYLWTTIKKLFTYNSPSVATLRNPNVKTSYIGVPLSATGVTADVKYVSDMKGCVPLIPGSLTGKIGLVEREDCYFDEKIKNMEDAGAIAVIIYDAPNSFPLPGIPPGSYPSNIPSVMIDNSEGEYIKTHLAANTTVNITLKDDPVEYITPDGSFDNGIIIHEYGHGVSNRLTGDGYSCLDFSQDKEQMGEGWSDFFALMLTNKPGNNASVSRGIGTYPKGEDITGLGIRPARYSPDFSVNNYTYGHTNGLEFSDGSPDVHTIGFIWATMLWDLHWKYAEKYGYSSDVLANNTNGSTRVIQLVTDALKLQTCNPTFVDGRNAILAAEQATTGGEDKCMIWEVFAKRGLGVNASAGDKVNINDQVEDFAVPTECNTLATGEVKTKKNIISLYPNPARNEFYINFPSNTIGKVSVELYDMSGKLVSSEDKISPDTKKVISTEKLINGTYIIRVKGLGFDSASKVVIEK